MGRNMKEPVSMRDWLFLWGRVINLDEIGKEKLLSRKTDTWRYVNAGGLEWKSRN